MKLTKSEEADMERIKVLEEMLDTSCKQIARLKKENQYLRAMLSGGATKVIGKLGFALGAACLSNTLSEIDIRKDERNKALSELREDLPDLDRWRNSKDNLLKSDILTEIDSRRTA